MRDPERIPMILAAVERRWRKDPDLRLGQLLSNLVLDRPLGLVEDARLLELIGDNTTDEQAYIQDEPRQRREGWLHWLRQFHRGRDV